VEQAEAPRLRLKPKLTIDATPVAQPSAPASPVTAIPPPAAPPVKLQPPPVPPDAPQYPPVIAKPPGAGLPPPVPKLRPPEPPPTPVESTPSFLPPPPVATPPKPKPFPPPRVPHLRAPGEMSEDAGSASASVAAKPKKSRKAWLLPSLGGVVVILLAVTYWLYRDNPKPVIAPAPLPTAAAVTPEKKTLPPQPAKPTAAPEHPKAGPTPSETINQIGAAPKETINRAQAILDKAAAAEQAQMPSDDDRSATVVTPPNAPVTPKPTPVAAKPTTKKNDPTASAERVSTEIAPGVTASIRSVTTNGAPSAAFKAWVANAKINGVFQGATPRILINGRTVGAGLIVDEGLEITFEGVDAQSKTIVFHDASGARVTRHY
jgi:hypothetical protein